MVIHLKKILIIGFLLFNGMLFAQSNYQSGLIIKNNGDTLRGFINAKEWTISPKFIEFKSTTSDKNSTSYNPLSIKGFQVGKGEFYLGYVGAISINPVGLDQLVDKADTVSKLDTTFLKRVTSGNNISLYYHQDEIKTRFFIASVNEKPIELRNYLSLDENHNVITKAIFKGELLLRASKFKPGNESIISKINNASYSQSDFISIINSLNDKQDQVEKKINYRFFVGAGVNASTTKFGTFNYTGITPKLNFGIDFFDNPEIQKLILRVDLSFFYVSPKFENFTIFDNTFSNSRPVYSYSQYNLALSPKVIYNFYNTPNLKIFISSGIGLDYATYTNNKVNYYDLGNQLQAKDNPYEFESFYIWFPIEAGIVFNKKIEINLNYILNATYTSYDSFSAQNQVNGLGIKYFFGK